MVNLRRGWDGINRRRIRSTSITGELEGEGNRLYILGLNILLKCKYATVVSASIGANGHGSGEISFKECYFTDLSLNKSETCNAEVLNAKFLALLVNHNGHGYVLFSPQETNFTQAHATSTPGKECLLPKLPVIKGSVVAKISAASGVHDTLNLISTKGMLTLFSSDKLFYGANEAHLEADATVSGGTQSQSGKQWLILDEDGTALTGAELSTSITGELEGEGNRLYILGLNILLKCKYATVVSASIGANGHGSGEISFKECYFTDLSLNKSETCNAEVLNAKFLALLVNHNGHGYVLFSPQETNFTQIHVTSTPGNECFLLKLFSCNGSVVAKIEHGPSDHLVEQLITTKNLLTLFTGDDLRCGGIEAHLEVDGIAGLAGAHEGLSWGYHHFQASSSSWGYHVQTGPSWGYHLS